MRYINLFSANLCKDFQLIRFSTDKVQKLFNFAPMEEKEYKALLSRLQAACVKREYCVRDICAKALKLTGDEQTAEKMVSELVADRFVDDLRYAAAFAREKASISGWGSVKISFALRGKGIGDAVIRQALEEVDASAATARMNKALAAKWKTLKDDPQGKYKLIRFALSRGYNYDEVGLAVEEIIASEDSAS